MRRRQSKPLNLSASLAQSNWGADLQKVTVFSRSTVEPKSHTVLPNATPTPSHAAFDTPPLLPASSDLSSEGDLSIDAGLFQPDAEAQDFDEIAGEDAPGDASVGPPEPEASASEPPMFDPLPSRLTSPPQALSQASSSQASSSQASALKSSWPQTSWPKTSWPKASSRNEPSRKSPSRAKPSRSKSSAGSAAATLPLAGGAARASARGLGSARYAYLAAGLGAVLWSGSFIAFVLGFEHKVRPLDYAPFEAVILAVLTVLPAAFMVLAAFAIRQGARLAQETRRARRMADELVQPAALAAAETGGVLEQVRHEVERASEASRGAHDQLVALRDALAQETDRLTASAADAQRTARIVGETLGRERDEIAALAASLHQGADGIAQAVQQQTRLVADASDLARSQLQEAEATLAARARDLTQATAAAGSAARDASDQLGRQTERLDATSAALVERLRHLDGRLTDQRNGLGELLETCNFDQDDIAARLETRRAQLVEVIAQSRVEAAELGQATGDSAEAVRGLIGEAAEQVRSFAAQAEAEQTALSQRAAEARAAAEADLQRAMEMLGASAEEASRGVEAQAEQVRKAAGAQVEAAKAQVEQLGELAFDAGQRANKAFDTRIGEARRLIEQSAAMIEEAGVRSSERIESGLDATRAALGSLAEALIDIDARMSKLPEDVRERADAVRQAVDRGVGDLTAAARRVAEETQAIDAAFQERVRRNYETLSEAARLMGRMAGPAEAAPAPAPPPLSSPAPVTRLSRPVTPAAPAPAALAPPVAASGDAADDFVPPEIVFRRDAHAPAPGGPDGHKPNGFSAARNGAAGATPGPVFGRSGGRGDAEDALALDPGFVDPPRAAAPADSGRPSSRPDRAAQPFPAQPYEPSQLRPRLKLTPTEADAALKTVFDPLQVRGREAEAARADGERPNGRPWESDMDEWTWKDLLSSIDDKPADDDALAEQMIGEIAALGVDASALLPHARVEEIVSALRAGDPSAARDSVRRLAPAAIRRLSRRVLTDGALREQANRYVRRFEGLVRGVAGRDPAMTSTLLGSDSGRAYLLLDAAVGDLQ